MSGLVDVGVLDEMAVRNCWSAAAACRRSVDPPPGIASLPRVVGAVAVVVAVSVAAVKRTLG